MSELTKLDRDVYATAVDQNSNAQKVGCRDAALADVTSA